jgi:hypothetical protein
VTTVGAAALGVELGDGFGTTAIGAGAVCAGDGAGLGTTVSGADAAGAELGAGATGVSSVGVSRSAGIATTAGDPGSAASAA